MSRTTTLAAQLHRQFRRPRDKSHPLGLHIPSRLQTHPTLLVYTPPLVSGQPRTPPESFREAVPNPDGIFLSAAPDPSGIFVASGRVERNW